MRKRARGLLVVLAALLFFGSTSRSGEHGQGIEEMANPSKYTIRMAFDNREAVAELHDHPATRDLVARLPLTLNFQDYVGKEKISYLDQNLAGDDSSPIRTGDFAYYAPWGNLALFYQGNGNAGGGLVVLGTIESGKENLAAMQADFTMTLELIQ